MLKKSTVHDGAVQARRKITSVQRRRLIIEAAVPLFTHEGFRGVTTKELAATAGVSEALLYQHFPSKEVLYEEVQDFCCQPSEELSAIMEGLTPSTEAFVQMLFFLVKLVVEKISLGNEFEAGFPRVMLHSMLDDGVFARLFIERRVLKLAALMQRCFPAARASGDLVDDTMSDEMRYWLCHHQLVAISTMHLPESPIVPYRLSHADLIDQTMLFLLRAVGLRTGSIKSYYDYHNLNRTAAAWLTTKSKGLG